MQWLRSQMEKHHLSQRALAESVGMTEQMFTNVVQGRRHFKASEVDAIRRRFGFSLPEDRPTSIAVVGNVASGDHIEMSDTYEKGGGLYQISRPQWLPASGIAAAQVDGYSAEPWALSGDIIFWRREAVAVFEADLGRVVVAELADGRVMLKRLANSAVSGRWSLLSLNPTHANLMDVELKWAARVFPVLARDDVQVLTP